MRSLLRVGWYRFRATFGRRWGGYLSLLLLVGLVGGLAMGAIGAARRTQSSFPALVQSVHGTELQGPISFYQPGGGPFGAGYDPSLLRTIAHQPQVSEIEVAVGLNTLLSGAKRCAGQRFPDCRPREGRAGGASADSATTSIDSS